MEGWNEMADSLMTGEIVAALEAMLRAYEQLMPGLRYIAVQDYANLNEAPLMAGAALYKLKKAEQEGKTR